ncbi:uncharacterized protein LOC124444035 [Xenia sp. Carnegie-2017]|uniref:uncharacterized protein LOC124444035 n=1 Tax=Xenia sp. Carnegie-2017 TaxID=2897299 RepID=UPI001F048660|nr:uncharacterized protein LOC124444035 [Xenia sp. Carnegie-2017]
MEIEIASKTKATSRRRLIEAIVDGRLYLTKIILKDLADLNFFDSQHRSPLMLAFMIDDEKHRTRAAMINRLLRHGADVNLMDNNGQHVLHWACKMNKLNLVRLLMEKCVMDIDLSSQDNEGNTPLMYAVLNSNTKMVKIIVDAMTKFRLTVDQRNKEDKTAYYKSVELGYDECTGILSRVGNASQGIQVNPFHNFDKKNFRGRPSSAPEFKRYGYQKSAQIHCRQSTDHRSRQKTATVRCTLQKTLHQKGTKELKRCSPEKMAYPNKTIMNKATTELRRCSPEKMAHPDKTIMNKATIEFRRCSPEKMAHSSKTIMNKATTELRRCSPEKMAHSSKIIMSKATTELRRCSPEKMAHPDKTIMNKATTERRRCRPEKMAHPDKTIMNKATTEFRRSNTKNDRATHSPSEPLQKTTLKNPQSFEQQQCFLGLLLNDSERDDSSMSGPSSSHDDLAKLAVINCKRAELSNASVDKNNEYCNFGFSHYISFLEWKNGVEKHESSLRRFLALRGEQDSPTSSFRKGFPLQRWQQAQDLEIIGDTSSTSGESKASTGKKFSTIAKTIGISLYLNNKRKATNK